MWVTYVHHCMQVKSKDIAAIMNNKTHHGWHAARMKLVLRDAPMSAIATRLASGVLQTGATKVSCPPEPFVDAGLAFFAVHGDGDASTAGQSCPREKQGSTRLDRNRPLKRSNFHCIRLDRGRFGWACPTPVMYSVHRWAYRSLPVCVAKVWEEFPNAL